MTFSSASYFSASSPLAVISALTRAISRAEQPEGIYEAALDALATGLDIERASVLLFDTDGVMRFKAWRGLSDAYRQAVEGHTPWSPQDRDVAPIVVRDVNADAALAPYQTTIRDEHIAAMAFIPLEGREAIIGKFMLYFDRPRDLAAEELQLATLIAEQVAFAVERTRSRAMAAAGEERLRFALDAANMGTWDWDLGRQSVRWSDNVERIHGLPAGTFDGTFQSYEREIHPEDRERVFASIQRALTQGVPHEVEYRIVGPDGTIRWVEGKGRVEQAPDGSPVRMSGVCMNITPRKQAELARVEALEQSGRISRRLAAIVEYSDDAIVSKDLNGKIMSWNRGAEQLFGYPAAEVVGQSILLIVPPELHDEEAMVLRKIRAGEAVEIETTRRRKDGTRVSISLKVSPVADADGRIIGASKIARDISARRRDEAERAELHRRLSILVTASASLLNSPEIDSVRAAMVSLAQQLLVADGYALWIAEPEQGRWRMAASAGVSPAFSERVITSFRGAAAPSAPAFSEPLPIPALSAQPMLEEQLEAYRAEGIRSMLVCPMRLSRGGGTLTFYYRTPHVFSDVDIQSGQALSNLATAALATADLHDQLRTQRNAAEAAGRQAAFLAGATALLTQSLDYERTLAAVARLAVPEIADWCAVDLVDPDGGLKRLAVAHVDPAKIEYARTLQEKYPDDPKSRGGVHEVIRTGKPAIMTTIPPELVAASARDEEHRRILAELALGSYICVPLLSTRGAFGAITLVFAESGRHYTEVDLRFAEEIAARAALAIENAFAYRRANEANRVKDEFLATLSHELRTPLNAILGYAQMLNLGMLDAERQAAAMTVVARNADALKQIIDDVLDLSRITSGKLRLNVGPVNLADTLRNALASMQLAADARAITLQLRLEADVPPVTGDPDRLQQVVVNLLSNAVKFTPRGGRVEVRLEHRDSMVRVVVADNGQGIPPAFLPHIFERFRQADSRFTREYGGLGLGLAIVHDLVELHGGTVSAQSAGVGAGSTFTVEFPARLAGTDSTILAPEHRAPSSFLSNERRVVPPNRLRGLRILAVDDEDDALGLLRVILESAGADVTTAGSAQQALEVLAAGSYDALIADIGMPRMNGLELIQRVRQTSAPTNRIPAAALTAYARSEDRVTALASGFQMHISKPVSPTELVTSVVALVGR